MNLGFKDYKYNGRWWSVPANFKFPKPSTLLHAWTAWLKGFGAVGNVGEVRPLRFIVDNKQFPPWVRQQWTNGWKPVLRVMGAIAKDAIGGTPKDRMNHAFVQATYDIAIGGLKDRCPHLFEGDNAERYRTWSVATWSRKLRGH